jgi:hypothetical protein
MVIVLKLRKVYKRFTFFSYYNSRNRSMSDSKVGNVAKLRILGTTETNQNCVYEVPHVSSFF